VSILQTVSLFSYYRQKASSCKLLKKEGKTNACVWQKVVTLGVPRAGVLRYIIRHRSHSLGLCPGEIVEIRREGEILATLDENGTFEGLQFMPEMRKYCGRKFKVLNRVNKIMVEGYSVRHVKNTVNLEGVTCDGEAHSGCKRSCFVLWKEAWLKRVEDHSNERCSSNCISLEKNNVQKTQDGTVLCQSGNLLKASSSTYPFISQINQFCQDIKCSKGTIKPFNYMRTLSRSLNLKTRTILTGKTPAAIHGKLKRTPTISLYLQAGETVEVRGQEEILTTLDSRGRNRGLGFSAEMLKYCGKRYQVLKRVDMAINEETGKLRQINNTVILEGVTCDGTAHGHCKRNCYCLWREIWLKRV
jgi:hypothetical protein